MTYTIARSAPTSEHAVNSIKAIGEAMFANRAFSLIGPKSRQWSTYRLAEGFAQDYLQRLSGVMPVPLIEERIAMLHTAVGMRGTKSFISYR